MAVIPAKAARDSRHKIIINVGSAGQPRDGDWRGCYVIHDEEKNTVKFRRFEYPVSEAQRAIFAVADLDDSLGERLATGT